MWKTYASFFLSGPYCTDMWQCFCASISKPHISFRAIFINIKLLNIPGPINMHSFVLQRCNLFTPKKHWVAQRFISHDSPAINPTRLPVDYWGKKGARRADWSATLITWLEKPGSRRQEAALTWDQCASESRQQLTVEELAAQSQNTWLCLRALSQCSSNVQLIYRCA